MLIISQFWQKNGIGSVLVAEPIPLECTVGPFCGIGSVHKTEPIPKGSPRFPGITGMPGIPWVLFKPGSDVILGVEVVDCEANPTGGKDYDGADDFANKADGLFENVDYCQNCQYNTDNVKN